MPTIHWRASLALAIAMTLGACSGGSAPATTSPPATGAAPSGPTPTPEAYAAPSKNPGPAVDKVLFTASAVDSAPLDFQQGKLDLYLYGLKTTAAQELKGKAEVRLEQASATSLSLLLNPAPAKEGELNPLAIKEVRRALQYLVNREYISSDLYQGQALPMITHLSPTDFDFLTIYEQARGADIRYDPELARSRIKEAMTKAGAQMANGVWTFHGKPILLKFIIRIEDERRDIGNLVMAELKQAGFQIIPQFKPFADAVLTVYSSDPQSFEWHIYTEGWSRGSPSRYDFAQVNDMVAPWLGNMPGWQETGFWQYENKDLDTLGKRLYTGDFADHAERDQIYRQMTGMAMEESVRVWVVTAMNSYPLNPKLRGVTTDPVAGPNNARTLRDAYIPGKDSLTVGNLWVWTERTIWNPVGGFGDAYSAAIVRNLTDPPIWNHPFTGLPIPNRATFQVETAGPRGKLPIPPDAVLWDATKKQWTPVGAQKQATSKVVLDYASYFNANWHHGKQISMADVIYPIAQSFDLAYDPAKSKIETALGVTSRPFLETFKGFRIADSHTLEVYVDFWHFETSEIASYGSPSGVTMPWEILAAMDDLVFTQRRAAFSDTAAARYNVSWLSLVMPSDARLVNRTLSAMNDKASVPAGVFTIGNQALVSPSEAQGRYKASMEWFTKYNHMFVGNGPYFLARFDPAAQFAEIHAFRDPTYPRHAGDSYLGRSPAITVSDIQHGKLSAGKAGNVTAAVGGPGKVGLRYVLIDPSTGKVVKAGEGQAVAGQGNKFTVSLDAQTMSGIKAGPYKLYVAGYSDQLATVAEREVDLDVGR